MPLHELDFGPQILIEIGASTNVQIYAAQSLFEDPTNVRSVITEVNQLPAVAGH